MKRLFIAFTFVFVVFSLNGTHVRSHTGLSDQNIWWRYSNPKGSWSGNVERVFTYKMETKTCRKYTLRKSTSDNRGWVEIGLNHNCYCWYSCIDRNTLVLPGDADWMKKKADGKWCYGKQVTNQVKGNIKSNTYGTSTWGQYYDSISMSDEQARNTIRDFCAQATRCQEGCS